MLNSYIGNVYLYRCFLKEYLPIGLTFGKREYAVSRKLTTKWNDIASKNKEQSRKSEAEPTKDKETTLETVEDPSAIIENQIKDPYNQLGDEDAEWNTLWNGILAADDGLAAPKQDRFTKLQQELREYEVRSYSIYDDFKHHFTSPSVAV